MAQYEVGRASDILPGERLLVTVARQSIGIFNIEGQFYALKNSCIHDQAPVCLGSIDGAYLPSAYGEYVWGKEGQILRCPWHGWEFDITTGASIFEPSARLTTYPVTVIDDRLMVEIGGKRS